MTRPSPWIMGRRWLVIQATPGGELVASAAAARDGWEMFCPRYAVTIRHAKRKPVEVIKPYLPGYLFAVAHRQLDPYDLSKTQGVAAVLRQADDWALIPDTDAVMRRLLAMADADGMIALPEAMKPITVYKPGDHVALGPGPFEGHKVLIEALDRKAKMASVWITILGGQTRMSVPYERLHGE